MAASATSLEYVQKMYIAYFGRPAAPTGQEYYGQLVDAGNIAALQDDFWNSAESQALFNQPTTEGKVNAIFNQLFGRDAAPSGLTYWTVEINAGRVSLPAAALTILNSAAAADADVFNAKMDVANAFTGELDTTSEILAYQTNTAGGRTTLTAIETQAEADAAVADITNIVADVVAGGTSDTDTFTLTYGVDKETANVFEAPRGYTPAGTDQVNTLNDDDVLTGTGANPTLNLTFVRDADIGGGANTVITPTLAKIETVNVDFAGSAGAYVLDLQDATDIQNINIGRVATGLVATVRNIAEAESNTLSVTDVQDPTSTVNFTYLDAALTSATNSVDLTLANVNTANAMRVEGNQVAQGFETLTLHSTKSANTVNQIAARSLQSAIIDGDQALTLGGSANVLAAAGSNVVEASVFTAGFGNVVGTLESINASAMTAALSINLGAEVVSTKAGTAGTPINFNFVGTTGNDTVRLLGGLNAGDTINMGDGDNNLVVAATARAGSVSNTDTLTILNQNAAATVIGVDAAITSGLTNVVIRNEGQAANLAAASALTANVVGLEAAAAGNIDVLHGTTGNNTIANNLVQIDTATGVSAVNVEIKDAVNTEARFNFNLYTDSDLVIGATGAITSGQNNVPGVNGVTTLTLADSDTESNTVALTAQGYTAAGALRGDLGTTYTTLNVTGGTADKFLNLDAAVAGNGNGYGVATTGLNGNATSVLIAAAPNGRDTVFDSVYAGTMNAVDSQGANIGSVFAAAGTGAAVRSIATTINAAAFAGDLVVRVGQADQAITTFVGDDTVIFDAVNDNRAGLTISDKVALGAGKDTIVIDGGFTVAAQTIALGASEWTNLTGVDVLRMGSNAGPAVGYNLTITDQLVDQTDSTTRLAIINNDGDLRATSTNSLTIDMRQSNGLSATNFVDFFGENGDTANAGNAALVGAIANRVILSDATANGGHVLNGGDIDLLGVYASTAAWAAANQGNTNTIEYRNTAVVTAGDQTGITNFDGIVFNNDQAVVQTLTLELTNAVMDAQADASHTASATQQESLAIRANDGTVAAPLAGAALNIDGRTSSNAFVLNIRSDDNAFANNRDVVDTINVNDNVGGTAGHTIDILDGGAAIDTLSFYGSAGDAWSAAATVITVAGTTNTGTVTVQNATGLATAVHTLNWDNGDVIRLTNDNGATFTSVLAGTGALTFNGGAAADTIEGTAGANIITGGAGADIITTGLGLDNVIFANNTVGVVVAGAATSLATADRITDFVGNGAAAGDTIQLGLGANAWAAATTFTGATVANVSAVTVALTGLTTWTAVTAAIEAALAGTATSAATAQVYDVTLTAGGVGDFNAGAALRVGIINDATATIAATDAVINLTGITGALNAGDFLFA